MHTHAMRFRAVTLAFLALGMNLRGEHTAARKGKEAVSAPAPAPTASSKSSSRAAVSSTIISEILTKDFSLDAGKSMQFTAASDFSGAERASIAIYAGVDQDITKTEILVWWAIPNAPSFVVQDVIAGSDFPFLNSGGGVVPAYGNQLMVEVRNLDTKTVSYKQVTVYAVAR